MLTGSCQITQKARLYAGGRQKVKDTDVIFPSTEFKKSRIRGRQVALRFSSDTLGSRVEGGDSALHGST